MKRVLLLSLVSILLLPNRQARGQTDITFGPTTLVNDFPNALTFQVEANATEGDIVAAWLYHALRNSLSTNKVPIVVQPGRSVTLEYTWDTSGFTVPPGAPLYYYWEVTDSHGNRASTPKTLIYYDDVRFDWKVLQDDTLSVWWHGQPAGLGESVWQIAQRSVEQQAKLYGAKLEYPIRVIIYNDLVEFAGWHTYVRDFVGGEAHPDLGITAQIVPPSRSQEEWLNAVIPHEIAHLYFYQVTHHPLSDPPLWLNEGLAQYQELRDHQPDLELARREILAGNLIRLNVLAGSFGHKQAEVRLAYAESISALTFLLEAYGSEALADLLAEYAAGSNADLAMQNALGLSAAEFEAGWLRWMGVPEEMYPTPTPWPTMAWLASPTPPPPPGTRTGNAATPTAPSATGIPLTENGTERAGPRTGTPGLAPTGREGSATDPRSDPSRFPCCLCPSVVGPLLLLTAVPPFRRARGRSGRNQN